MEIMNEYLAKYLELVAEIGLTPELSGLIILVFVWLVLFLGRELSFFRFLMRWYQRILLLAALCALGFWLFLIGREHQIFLDNKTLNEHRALEQVNVSINGGEVIELMTRERDVRKTVGPEFEIKAEVFDEDGEIVNTLTKKINIGLSKDIMINLPAFTSGSDDYIVPAPR